MPKRYKYGMKHQWITDLTIGKLLPIFSQEVTPGDTWQGSSTGVFRLSPLNLPAFMSLGVHVHYFFVPHRLLWDDFEEVITGADEVSAWPKITYSPVNELMQAFGIGINVTATPDVNALPIYAYNKVWNDYFRNDLLVNEIPLTNATVKRINFPTFSYEGSITSEIQQGNEETVDSSGATIGATEIRDTLNRQRFRERRAQYGEKYRDLLMSDFGIMPSDVRLDRPEHCAQAKTTIGISEVVATATSASENTGEYKGHGIAGLRVKFPKRRFEEHGTLLGVAYARPRLQLRHRMDRQFFTQDKDDLYNPSLSSDTQVVVQAGEIYSDTTATNFGYQARDQWLRTARDTIANNMMSTVNYPWTAPVDLTGVPTIGFLQEVQDYDEIFQDQTADRVDLSAFMDHKISKISQIPRRKK